MSDPQSMKMSELTEGMVIDHHGMKLLLTDRHERELDPDRREDADIIKGLEAAGHPLKTYWFTGIIQNVEEVEQARRIPFSYRRGGKWRVQGNDLVTHTVISKPTPLTPYDTGVRLEPKPWHVQPANLPDFEEADRYGRVDFDNDAGETVLSVLVKHGPSGPVLQVTDHSGILTVKFGGKFGDNELRIAEGA